MPVNNLFDKHGFLLLSSKSITIQGEQGWAQLALTVISGTVIVTGATGLAMGTEVCGATTLPVGTAITLGTGISAVDDLTIDASAGVVLLVGVTIKNPN